MARQINRLAFCPQTIGDGVHSLSANHEDVCTIMLRMFPQVFQADDFVAGPEDLTQLVTCVWKKTNVKVLDIIYYKATTIRQISFFFGSSIGRSLMYQSELKEGILKELRFGRIPSMRVFSSYNSKTKELGFVFSSSVFQAVRRSTWHGSCECEIMSVLVPEINLLPIQECENAKFERGAHYSCATRSFSLRDRDDVQQELLMQISVDFASLTPTHEYLYGPYGNSLCFE